MVFPAGVASSEDKRAKIPCKPHAELTNIPCKLKIRIITDYIYIRSLKDSK
jgi:hypothetical protein